MSVQMEMPPTRKKEDIAIERMSMAILQTSESLINEGIIETNADTYSAMLSGAYKAVMLVATECGEDAFKVINLFNEVFKEYMHGK